ncbi:MAG: 30S ribosomal protein S1 [Candidatus Ancillula sp.]|jgi:small subunit ribosomal protein S1|nr:30S ribosomal protein S1 [Candidatus Ancillula sp.]
MVTNEKGEVVLNTFKSADELIAAVDKTIKYFKDGDVIEGTVVKIDRDEVLLDVNYKTEGVIPVKELSIQRNVKPEDLVKIGDKLSALVIQKEDKEGRLILSKKRAAYEKAWEDIIRIKEEGTTIEGAIIEVVKGGAIVDIGLRGFLPASQLDLYRIRDIESYVGQKLDFKVIELDKNRNNVVLSHRAILVESQAETRGEFLAGLAVGQIRKGVVSSIVSFGAFVDLGGVDGLVHVSELSWHHVDHPSEVVKVGQEVTVEVFGIEDDRERVSLSIKATQEDPWQIFARNHAIGQIVPGEIVKLVTFGAFIKVGDGIEGLVHISELSSRHISSADQITAIGDKVFAKIVDIDLERRRISLSIKQANELIDYSDGEFDPALYGAAQNFDSNGNYIYPEGFDSEKNEWREGFEDQKEQWESNYIKARSIWKEHVDFANRLHEAENKIADTKQDDRHSKSNRNSKRNKTSEPAQSSFGEVEDNTTALSENEGLAALKDQLAQEKTEEA